MQQEQHTEEYEIMHNFLRIKKNLKHFLKYKISRKGNICFPNIITYSGFSRSWCLACVTPGCTIPITKNYKSKQLSTLLQHHEFWYVLQSFLWAISILMWIVIKVRISILLFKYCNCLRIILAFECYLKGKYYRI